MSLGLPVHLAESRTNSAIAAAMRASGMVAAVAAMVAVVGYQLDSPDVIWPAALALVPGAVLVSLAGRIRWSAVSAVTFIVNALGLAVFSASVMASVPEIASSGAFVLTAAKIGLILIAGAGSSGLALVAWSAGGLLAAEGITAGAALLVGVSYGYDAGAARVFFLVLIVIGFSAVAGRRSRAAQPGLHRAAQAEELQSHRARMESQAAAMLHDTVLGDLAAISGSRMTVLSDELRARMNGDLELLIGQDWLGDSVEDDLVSVADEKTATFHAAIAEGSELGLDVTVTGSLGSLARLPLFVAESLGLAIRQCLINVRRHAGTELVEVAVSSSPTEVSVMVVDSGTGFDVDSVDATRLGLRHSVVGRIRAVDGTVHVWSTPGHGTSILISIPFGIDADADVAESRSSR